MDSDGNIEFPVLGTIEVEGINRQELAGKLEKKVSEYVQDPIVNVRIVNFQVSVLGEVNRPGTFDIRDEYLSLPKALGLAGDMSIYGKKGQCTGGKGREWKENPCLPGSYQCRCY